MPKRDNVRALEKELARLKSRLAASQGDDLASQAVDVKGAKVLAALLEGADVTALRETMDKLRTSSSLPPWCFLRWWTAR